FREAESLKRAVAPIQHDLRMALKQQRQRPPRRANIHRLPQPVEHQHMLVENRTHTCSDLAPSYTKGLSLSNRTEGRDGRSKSQYLGKGALARLLPPHLRPLPRGEGELSPACSDFERLEHIPVREMVPPSPLGRGQG